MNTAAIFELAVSTLAQYGLLDQGWRVEWDNGKRRAGACHYTRRVISLSRHLMPTAPDHEVRETILHEVAHALTPGHHHDATWAAKLREMGGTGSRTHSMETVRGRYDMYCTACGKIEEGNRHQAQGTWKHNIGKPSPFRYYVHRKCGTGKMYLVDTKAPATLPAHIQPAHTFGEPLVIQVAAQTVNTKSAKPTTGKVCLCGCGEQVTNNYKPGHDARHVSNLAKRILAGEPHGKLEAELPTPALKAKLTARITGK